MQNDDETQPDPLQVVGHTIFICAWCQDIL